VSYNIFFRNVLNNQSRVSLLHENKMLKLDLLNIYILTNTVNVLPLYLIIGHLYT